MNFTTGLEAEYSGKPLNAAAQRTFNLHSSIFDSKRRNEQGRIGSKLPHSKVHK